VVGVYLTISEKGKPREEKSRAVQYYRTKSGVDTESRGCNREERRRRTSPYLEELCTYSAKHRLRDVGKKIELRGGA